MPSSSFPRHEPAPVGQLSFSSGVPLRRPLVVDCRPSCATCRAVSVRRASMRLGVMGVVRRSIGPRPPDPYYGSPPSSRRRTIRTHIEEPSGCRVEVGNAPLTGSFSSTIPPSGRATILLGDDLIAVEAVHEMPLILGDPESEDIFAQEQEEVQRTAVSIGSQAVGVSSGPSQLQSQADPSLPVCSSADTVSDTDTARNILEPTPAEMEQSARIALTQYRPRRSSNREPLRPEHIILDPTNAPPTIDLEAMVATAVSSGMSVIGTTSVFTQEP